MDRVTMCLPVGAVGTTPPDVACLILEPTDRCHLRDPSSQLLEFRRIGMATFPAECFEFLGLGPTDTREKVYEERIWSRKPVVLKII